VLVLLETQKNKQCIFKVCLCTYVCIQHRLNDRNKLTNFKYFNKPSADRGLISLVHACTENGLSDGISEITVNDIKPLDSNEVLMLFRNRMAIINAKICMYHVHMIKHCRYY